MNKILILVMGLLLIGVNVFAQGDLLVNGDLGVGTSPVPSAKVTVSANDTAGLNVIASTNGTVSTNALLGLMDINLADSTQKGLAFQLNYKSSGTAGGSGIIAVNDSSMGWNAIASDGVLGTSLIQLSNNVSNTHTGTSTAVLGYGMNLLSAGGSGSGSVHYTAFYRHIGIQNLGDRFRKSSGVLMDGTVSGIWMEQQTRGSTNYGIVLAGDGAGSDIVFGPNQELRLYADISSPGNEVLVVSGGLYTTGNNVTSDEKFKQNITNIDNSLEKIMKINGVTYDWKQAEFKEKNFDDRSHYGVIAQDIEKAIPEIVSEINGEKSVAYDELIPILIEAVKEQQKTISDLKHEVAELKQEVKMKGSIALLHE
jgi:hypothetical protein